MKLFKVLLTAIPILIIFSIIDAFCASIWPTTTSPGVVDSGPDSAVELGVKFKCDSNGSISGIRFYKASSNTGTHVANLWTSAGSRLATATFANETASGWQQVNFSAPVAVTANTVYAASYHTNVGHYSDDQNYFAGKGTDSPPLHALADGISGVNGIFTYGSTSSFPQNGWDSSNYWVDVIFSPSDTIPPAVTAFSVPSTATNLTVPISSFIATDNVAVTGYLVNESATIPVASGNGWSTAAPSTYTFTTAGSKTLYAWAKDAAGNVSANKSAAVIITLSDTIPPTVTAFTVPATSTTLSVPISSFTATDNIAVTGYQVNESPTAPAASGSNWITTAQASYTFATAGNKTLYAWAKDSAGNVSNSKTASVMVTLTTTGGPEATGWYAGDMHVHRSCGGAPMSVATMFQKMNPQDLAVISLLADMGNGEVQNPVTDLPLVNGKDASVSIPGQILHWDTEWHWDPTYYQYPHQALGGHIVALGLSNAKQVWQEYTYPIFQWVHQRGGIAGFAHMEYLDDTNTITNGLTCCTPIEYPVEVALGSSDFISEDVSSSGSTCGGGGGVQLYPENAIKAYYRLLNCGFRPGLAAGTDYPCNCNNDLGSLLTYVQVAGGKMTYRNWISGIAAGRTVISRNGHNEFISLTVNGSATPGDEIKLTGGGNVQVAIQWTANQSLSGTIELVNNGVVVASKKTSATLSTPASLSATVNFTKSGWLAARRMGSDGHQVHTAAVFVLVDDKQIRASADDAQFYVEWMDNLLEKTSPGGAWNSFFVNNLSAAQARYQTAKAVFQQIESDASGTTPPGGGPSIFTNQIPTAFDNDSSYELGTKFWADVNGQITQVRIYTYATESGAHTVRIWQANGSALIAGPYTWNIISGTLGWQAFTLPTPLNISPNTDYIVAITNSSGDRYYAEQTGGFNAPIVNGNLHTYVGSGVYTNTLGTMPTLTWQNTNYFRDIVFTPQ